MAAVLGIRYKGLTISEALGFLKEKDRSAYDSIVRSDIVKWDWKDYSKYDRQLEQDKNIKEAFRHRFTKLSYLDLALCALNFNFLHFPELKLYYESKGDVNCLDWMSKIHIIVDAEAIGSFRPYPHCYLSEYFSPKDTGLESIFLFRTPMSLLKYLTEGNKVSSDVKIKKTYEKTMGFLVTGYSDEIELSYSFIDWMKGLSSGKGVNDFLNKILNFGLLDQRTYDVVIKSETEPIIEYSELSDKDIDRLRKIDKIKDPHSYSWWGKKVLGLTSRQGPSDFLDKMEKGGYVNPYKSDLGVRVELTEKGLRAIA